MSSGGFCIVVASQIHLLDPSCVEHKATINLGEPATTQLFPSRERICPSYTLMLHIGNAIYQDCDPELVAFSRNSSFLVVGDSLGTIHFIHVESKNIVFSQEICPESVAVIDDQDDIPGAQRTSRNAFNVLCFASSDRYALFCINCTKGE